jgi:ribonuclease HI
LTQRHQDTLLAFSDGSALGNPGPGGYGAVLNWNGQEKELCAGFRMTTNNRMELLGAIVALETLNRRCRVVLSTDSQYVVNGIEKGWARSWRANGWRRNKKEKALNTDLWERLLRQVERHDVRFEWVRGHVGHPENERCDELANSAARNDAVLVDEEYEMSMAAAE